MKSDLKFTLVYFTMDFILELVNKEVVVKNINISDPQIKRAFCLY